MKNRTARNKDATVAALRVMNLTIDITSDVICPWCFIGKRRLEAALAQLRIERPDVDATIRWLPYVLDPDTPLEGQPYRPYLEMKFGGPAQVDALQARVREAGRSAGLELAFDKIELRANTLNAHRLIHHFQQRGLGDIVVEQLFAAHFLLGEHIGDVETLADIASACGGNRTEALAYLASDQDAAEISAQAKRAQASGITGVPFFIFNGRLALSGAQPAESMFEAMRQALQDA
jgi:predicted DsbA family dithiol-disulfide isomerase